MLMRVPLGMGVLMMLMLMLMLMRVSIIVRMLGVSDRETLMI
jgi:hypothetical protein